MRIPRLRLFALGVLAMLAVTVVGLVLAATSQPGGPGRPPAVSRGSTPAPVPSVPPVLAAATPEAPPTAAGLAAALGAALRDPALGPGAAAVVADAGSGRLLLSAGASGAVPPASTAKILTAAAALERLGPSARIETRVVPGLTADSLVLVGGGDATLAGPAAPVTYPRPARLADLASAAAKSLTSAGVRRVRLTIDASLFTGPALGPAWSPGYVADGDVAPVSALAVDGGRVRPGERPRSPDPALAAGRLFAQLLGRSGVTVVGPVVAGQAPAGAVPVAVVRSPAVAALVERMLTESDNDLAEALARLVAVRTGLPGTFAGGSSAVTRAVVALGVDPAAVRLYDGSGLSKANRLEPRALTTVLSSAASTGHAELRPLLSGLPVAGLTGTLADRYAAAPASGGAGLVRAKTGTLAGVSTLAGVTLDTDGDLLAFAFVAPVAPDRRGAERALDRLAAVLAGCGCD